MPFALLLLTVVATAVATFWPDGRAYDSLWYVALWAAVAVTGAATVVGVHLWRRMAAFALHLSFLLILAGALTTYVWGEKGVLHLRTGAAENVFRGDDGTVHVRMPFALRLDSFVVKVHPGTDTPADYVSYVSILTEDGRRRSEHGVVAMNRVLDVGGYRLTQASYDVDGRGTLLCVNHDPMGIVLTYSGYGLLTLSVLWLLVIPGGGFRHVGRKLSQQMRRMGMAVALCAVLPLSLMAERLPVVNRLQADSLAKEQVVYNGRVAPFNTVALDCVRKLTGESSFRSLTPEQVLVSWCLAPHVWKRVPMIRVGNDELAGMLHADRDGMVALASLFDAEGNYVVEALPLRDSPTFRKSVRELDERVAIMIMLTQGTLFTALPDGVERLSAMKVKAELLYNALPMVEVLAMTCLTLGVVAFILVLMRLTRPASFPLWTVRRFPLCSTSVLIAGAAALWILRWYISGTIPLTNGYETLLFSSVATLGLTLVFGRRIPMGYALGLMVSGLVLLVAWLTERNPQVTAVVPVLHSPWLAWHVSIVMIAYCLFALITVNAIVWVFARMNSELQKVLTLSSRFLLWPAVLLMAVGIFLGAVWANESWGSYWSWDPKESWALITMVVYACGLHSESIPIMRRERSFHVYMLFCFLTVLMTYFGVTYFLGGMHSYG